MLVLVLISCVLKQWRGQMDLKVYGISLQLKGPEFYIKELLLKPRLPQLGTFLGS
jgi:hypothetical protein